MRPYRGKRKDNGEWVYGWYCENEELHYIIPDTSSTFNARINPEDLTSEHFVLEGLVEVDSATVGQSTGLKDKNGKEIYDNDKYKDADGIVSIVEMAVDGWALFPVKKDTPVRNLYWHNVFDKTKGEIIGTIHSKEQNES